MTIQVTGKNLDVGEALRSYVQGRVGQTVEKFIGRDTTGHVRIEKEHGEFRTNCSIHLWQGMSLEAHGVAPATIGDLSGRAAARRRADRRRQRTM
jgi:ribosome-associated translation inhibitor RaiA